MTPLDNNPINTQTSAKFEPEQQIQSFQGRTFQSQTPHVSSIVQITHYLFSGVMENVLYGKEESRKNLGEDGQICIKILKERLENYENGITTRTFIETEDNVKLELTFIQACYLNPGKDKTPIPQQETVIICTGNGASCEWQAVFMAQEYLDQGINVVLYNGRGFGESEGVPSENGSYLDIEAVYNHVKGMYGQELPDDKILVHGYSLGGGAATHLAAEHPVHLIADRTWAQAKDISKDTVKNKLGIFAIAISPFVNLIGNVIETYYRYDNEEKIGKVKGKVLIAHGKDDLTMTHVYAERLKNAYLKNHEASDQKLTYLIVDGGHAHAYAEIDLINPPPWFLKNEAFNQFLNALWKDRIKP